MYATELKKCDIVIWSKYNPLYVETIDIDMEFKKKNVDAVKLFHQIVPELLISWFTNYKQNNLWCICGQADNGRRMVRCSGIN